MAKLADAADLKSADLNRSWGFKSPSGHHITVLRLGQPYQAPIQVYLRPREGELLSLDEGENMVDYSLIIGMVATGATAGMKGLASVLLAAMNDLNTALGNYAL